MQVKEYFRFLTTVSPRSELQYKGDAPHRVQRGAAPEYGPRDCHQNMAHQECKSLCPGKHINNVKVELVKVSTIVACLQSPNFSQFSKHQHVYVVKL